MTFEPLLAYESDFATLGLLRRHVWHVKATLGSLWNHFSHMTSWQLWGHFVEGGFGGTLGHFGVTLGTLAAYRGAFGVSLG